jgi:hypothetical protein
MNRVEQTADSDNLYRTYRFETLYELGWTLVVFEVFDDEHHDVVVFELAEVLDHQPFDERLQLAVN